MDCLDRDWILKFEKQNENCNLKFTSNSFLVGIWSHHFMGNRWGDSGNSIRLHFLGAPKSLQVVIAAMKLKDTYSLEGKL